MAGLEDLLCFLSGAPSCRTQEAAGHEGAGPRFCADLLEPQLG